MTIRPSQKALSLFEPLTISVLTRINAAAVDKSVVNIARILYNLYQSVIEYQM